MKVPLWVEFVEDDDDEVMIEEDVALEDDVEEVLTLVLVVELPLVLLDVCDRVNA